MTTKQQNSQQTRSVRAVALTAVQQAVQTRYQKQFWISFARYSAVMVLIILVFILMKDSQIWYAYDPWYSVLFIMKTAFPFIIVAIWLAGAAFLLYRQWQQSAADIVGLMESIEQMQTGVEGDIIRAPENLRELQPVLQDMFDDACEDRKVAREADQKKNDLILYLAHDLKTPLTSVVGYLSLLDESKELSEAQRDSYTKIAQEKALRLESLIEQFFEISRFSLHETELTKAPFSLNLLFDQLVEEFFPLLEEQGKTITVKIEEEIEFYGDANMLARVFNNIIKNALAYGIADSAVEVSAHCTSNDLVVAITNAGENISKDQLDAVFDKFFRLDSARSTDSGGAGLGLAIAKEIIVKHEGTIQASSGGGKTTFTVTLPRQAP